MPKANILLSIKGLCLLFLAIQWEQQLHAQDSDTSELSDRIVTVGDWEPRIGQVQKLKVEPSLIDTVPPKPELSYSNRPAEYKTSYHLDRIEAARIRVNEALDPLDKGYLKLGMGTFTTPLGEAYFSSDRSKDHQYSARIFHRSSEGGVKNNDHADWSSNGINVNGKWTRRKNTFKAGLGYRRDVRHHYGFPREQDTLDLLKDKDLRQRFHDFRADLGWKKYNGDSTEIDHDIGLEMHHFMTLDPAMEFNADLDGSFDRFVEEEHIRLDAGVDHNTLWTPPRDSGKERRTKNNTLIHLTPNIVSKGDGWKVKVGMKVQSEVARVAKFHFYPNGEAHYVLFDGIFIPYSGLRGGLERNNLRSFSRMNPHISAEQELRNTNVAYDLYGGIRGSLSKYLNFDVRASKRKLENYPLLVNDSLGATLAPGNRFQAVYDDGAVISVKGELSYYRGERFKFNLSGAYHDYRLKNEARAWHRPIFEASFHGWYDIQDKFTVEARVRYMAPRFARSSVRIGDSERNKDIYILDLDAYVDANLGIEYRYTKDLSAFLRFNNLINSRYQRWYGYPVQGFQVLGGLTYSL